ncbi:Anaphase-promoting complex subunit 1 [Coemansia sp. RSA 1358]|nr:Anaphase-promoting complex subunit 1 [Coemansia sp. RSA 1358]
MRGKLTDDYLSNVPSSVLTAFLDDIATGCHRAHSIGAAISWSLNGRFVRSFRLSSTAKPLSAAQDAVHVVFARFKDTANSNSSTNTGCAFTVALCIFGTDTLGIHYYSGESFMLTLPFSVQSVYPLQAGLIVQRKIADPADMSPFASSTPIFFSLLGPRSEFKMIGLSRSIDLDIMRKQKRRQIVLSPTPAKNDIADGSLPIFNDQNTVLVGTAASRHNPSRQFVLCWDSAAQRCVLYQCTVLDPLPDGERERDVDVSVYSENMSIRRTSGSGADHDQRMSASRPRLSRQASLSVQRRSSAAVSAAAMAAASRRMSSYASAAKNDRRGSLLGRVSFNDSPGVGYAADIFREQRQMRAEVVLHTCWKERRQKGVTAHGSSRAPLGTSSIYVIQTITGNDVVCILNKDTEQIIGLETTEFTEIFRCSARSMAPVRALRTTLDDLAVVNTSGQIALLLMVNTSTSTSSRDKMVRLTSLLLTGSDKGRPPATLPLHTRNELRDRASAVLYALHLVYEDAALYKSEPRSRLLLLGQMLCRLAYKSGLASAYLVYLRSGFGNYDGFGSERSSINQQASNTHPLIIPSLFQWALSAFNLESKRPTPFPTLADTCEIFGITDSDPAYGAIGSLKLLDAVSDTFYHLAIGQNPVRTMQHLASLKNPLLLVSQMTPELQWLFRCAMHRIRELGSLHWPPEVLRLLGRFDLIANSKDNNAENGISTPMLDGQYTSVDSTSRSTNINSSGIVDDGDKPDEGSAEAKDIVELCNQVIDRATAASRDRSNAGNNDLSAQYHAISPKVFKSDLRVDEIERLLQVDAVTHTAGAVSGPEPTDDAEAARMQYMNYLARRVLALPLGRSLLKYSTCDLNSQDSLSVTNPRVAARFRGNKVETVWAAGDSDMHWPLFHSGVAAALSIERDQLRQAHSSWVLLHWPSETSPSTDNTNEEDSKGQYRDALSTHAGLLFGMGLLSNRNSDNKSGIIGTDSNSIFFAGKKPPSNGPLCDVPPWQVFKYLSIRHGLTSIALLLGYACAHRGSMSGSVSKILSLHIPNLLPPGSSELMLLSYGIQAAAMLGLGLLFMKSQNRRMAEVMLHELSSMKWATPDNTSSRLDDTDPAEGTAECYSLASGFALGFVALGQGLATRTLADLRLLDALSELLSGATTNIGNMIRYSSQPAESAALNSNSAGEHSAYYGSMPTMFSQLSTAPASGGKLSDLGVIAAIGLVFLGTNYMPAAQRLALPASFNQLKVADPFIVLWKTLMRSLIMLDHISTTKEWVESNMPCHSNTVHEPHSKELQRMRMHVVSAACFSIALKFAGTEDQAAHSTILAYFDELESIVARPALGYESNLTRSSAQLCLDIICISAALVMAGSGDIETMKRLRALHSVSASRTYGNHMASHMALGVLFLGGGARFTISRSLDTMALLVVSFFPRFPQHYSDNREHLQAWRHLWSLCVEPRCLIVRDTTTGIMCENVTATVFKSGPDGTINSELAILPLPLLALKGAQSMRLQALVLMTEFRQMPAQRFYRAIMENDIQTLKWLVDARKIDDICNKGMDSNGWTSLMLAARYGRFDIAAYLLELGHDDEAISVDAMGNTVPVISAKYKHEDICLAYLERYPKTISNVNCDGSSAINLAAQNGLDRVISWILDHGGNVNQRDIEGNTPLHYAASWNQYSTVSLLLERDAQSGLKNHKGYTAIEYAYSSAMDKHIRETVMRLQYKKQKQPTGGSFSNAHSRASTEASSPLMVPPKQLPISSSADQYR